VSGAAASSSNKKSAAEEWKRTGNDQMSRKDYASAIRSYTSAANLNPTNPIYYSNCAAAHAILGDHVKVIENAKSAIQADPTFVKAYYRLGYGYHPLFEASAE
jgi:small glutamine-rich tetratricopeptide repeat-containing protein alpha